MRRHVVTGDGLVVEWIAELPQALERRVEARSARPGTEVIELALLLQDTSAGRLGGLKLQGQKHALMAAILLRVPGLMRSTSMPSRSHHTESLE